MTASKSDKLYRILMLLRTYRLVRCNEKLIRDKYLSRKTDADKRRPEYMNHPTIEEVRNAMRIYTTNENKKDLIFTRTLNYAFNNKYIEYSRNSPRGYEEVDPIKYTSVNGERLLEGVLYYGFVKELLRVNNNHATLIISLIALAISVATYIYTISR